MIGFVSSYYFTIFLYLVKIKKFRKSLKVKLLRNSIRLISIKIQFRLQPSVLRLSGLYASLKCNFPSHKLCIFLYFSRSLQKSVPVTLLLSPKFPFWGDQNSHFDNNSPSLPLIGGIRFRIWGKNHPPKIQISNGS